MRTLAIALALALGCVSAVAQDKTRVVLTPRSNVSASEVGKGLDKYCSGVVLSDDPTKAHYTLEAWDTGAGPGRKPYKFTLFYDDDRVFSTETRGVNGAVKDVCEYIQKQATK